MTVGAAVSEQAAAFAGACCLGAGIGLFYDLLRLPRSRIPSEVLGGVLDAAFWLAATAVLFFWSVKAGDGEIRLYIAAALFLGAAGYFAAFSPIVRRMTGWMADGFCRFCRFVSRPVILCMEKVKKGAKTAKKLFAKQTGGYKIHLRLCKVRHFSQRIMKKEDARRDEGNQADGLPGKNSDPGAAHLSVGHAAFAGQQDHRDPG